MRRASKQQGRDIDRRAVLDAASAILADEGPAALTMRRLAADVGASTMVLYSRFGSRDALLSDLLAEGMRRFADELGRVSDPDPFAQLRALGLAYRRFARENPTYYRLLWNPAAARCDDPAAVAQSVQRSGHGAYAALVGTVTRVLAALDKPARDVEPLAFFIWSTVHGFVSLELAGQLPPAVADAAYDRTLSSVDAAVRAA